MCVYLCDINIYIYIYILIKDQEKKYNYSYNNNKSSFKNKVQLYACIFLQKKTICMHVE